MIEASTEVVVVLFAGESSFELKEIGKHIKLSVLDIIKHLFLNYSLRYNSDHFE